MTDLEALREYASFSGTPIEMRAVLLSSADRIERLEASLVRTFEHMMADGKRVDTLEAALRDLSDGWECCPVSQAMRRVAREALERKDD